MHVCSNLTGLGSKALLIIERVKAENDKKKQDESEESRGKNENIPATSTQETSASVETVATFKRH